MERRKSEREKESERERGRERERHFTTKERFVRSASSQGRCVVTATF